MKNEILTRTVQQCRSCPWRVDCEPLIDIPNGYSVELHERLRQTIAVPGAVDASPVQRIMACHYSPVGEEFPCAGWLHHQRGVGNNLWLRIEVARGRMPVPEVIGEQHPTFQETLPLMSISASCISKRARPRADGGPR